MKNHPYALSLLLICLVILTSCQKNRRTTMPSLVGAWKITEIRIVGPDVDITNPQPQPGLFIFSKNHYSMIWSPGRNPRPDSETIWEPTDAEKIRYFNTIIVNSGTWTQTDSTLTTYPVVAKTPEFVGGSALYEYYTSGDTLWMTALNTLSRDGVVDSGIVVYKTPLKLIRIE